MNKCVECGSTNSLSSHHVFGGRNRKLSDKYGALETLCFKCHRECHDAPDQELNMKYKQIHQNRIETSYIVDYGLTDGEAREKFISEFGRNYL